MARTSSRSAARARKPAEAQTPVPSEDVEAAEAQAAADAADSDAEQGEHNPGAGDDPMSLDAIVLASKDSKSALEDAQTMLGLIPRIADGLLSLVRLDDDARRVRLALAPLIMQVRYCFTFNGKPDEHGKGNAYKQAFNRLITRKVHAMLLASTPDSKISEADVEASLKSIRENILATEGRKDTSIVEHGHATGDIDDADFAAWEAQLAEVDGKPRKLEAAKVPEAVKQYLRTSYKHAEQNVPVAYETSADKATREAEAAARAANRPSTSGPKNPEAVIAAAMTELIATGAGHPDILAEQLHRGLSHLSDTLLGVPGEAPSTSEVPNRVQRVIPTLDTLGKLGVFTAEALKTPPGTTKESLAGFRYVETPEVEQSDIMSKIHADMVGAKQKAADAAADAADDSAS